MRGRTFLLVVFVALSLAAAPLPRELAGHVLVYSSRVAAVILVGGDAAGNRPLYRLQGVAWVPIEGSELPVRSLPAVAVDTKGNILMHGGAIGIAGRGGSIDFTVTPKTWLWDGAKWTLVAASGPDARDHHGMVYDSARDTYVLFGGSNADPSGRSRLFGDTWEWRGGRWTLASTSGPGPRVHLAMVYDPEH